MKACSDYFIKKWGAEPRYDSQLDRDKLYKHPFNDITKDLKFYENHSIEELISLYKLK